MSLKFKGTIREFRTYIAAMQLIFGKDAKVKDVTRKMSNYEV